MKIRQFMQNNFKHFNAATCVDAAEGWIQHLKKPGKMLVSLAGAMSTGELGISLAEMIRQDKVHAISCSGANLEEDIFNLVAHNSYLRIPHYRYLSKEEENDLLEKGMNRVTDTCIPEDKAIQRIGDALINLWKKAEKEGKSHFPYEYMYKLLDQPQIQETFEIPLENSWVLAAKERNIPIFSPGWEDSSVGNIFVAQVLDKTLNGYSSIKSGLEQMALLVDWYRKESQKHQLGFFQIGGGIAGDFAICVVPLLRRELEENIPLWDYFCQISDSITSFGSYSGAVPNEKITWGKLGIDTPSFTIESDATIVAPLIFHYVLGT